MMQSVYNTEVLGKVIEPYDINLYKGEMIDFDFSKENGEFIAARMLKTCEKYRSGFCTARQVGLGYNIFVIGIGEFVAYFNPKVEFFGEQKTEFVLNVIEYPNMLFPTKMYKNVRVNYYDFTGIEHTVEYSGVTAMLIQQCVNSLKEITPELSDLKFQRAKKAFQKRMKFLVRSPV